MSHRSDHCFEIEVDLSLRAKKPKAGVELDAVDQLTQQRSGDEQQQAPEQRDGQQDLRGREQRPGGRLSAPVSHSIREGR